MQYLWWLQKYLWWKCFAQLCLRELCMQLMSCVTEWVNYLVDEDNTLNTSDITKSEYSKWIFRGKAILNRL